MTRIVAGVARGRRLAVPPSGTRPTSDRAREGLFSSLGDVEGLRFLDLYAGSGAVGLEALSRGASYVLLVEKDPRAVAVLRRNVSAVGLPGAEVRAAPVGSVDETGFDVVFADPPYDVVPDLAWVVARAAPGGVVVVERSSRDAPLAWPPGVERLRERRYGDGTLWYGRAP